MWAVTYILQFHQFRRWYLLHVVYKTLTVGKEIPESWTF